MTPARLAGARQALAAAREEAGRVDLSWLPEAEGRDSWTMDDGALRFVAGLVAVLRPPRIVEFGSGLSTRVMAAACAGVEGATVVSIESDPTFARRARESLAADPSGDRARLVLTHLVARRWYERNMPVYDLPASVLQRRPPQLVLVDGPPLPLGGRTGSLLQAVHLSERGTVILLDDADRPGEQAALALAAEVFGDAVEVVPVEGFAKGLAAVVVNRPVVGSAMPPAPPEGGG